MNENNVIDVKRINFEKEKDMNEKFGIKQNIDDKKISKNYQSQKK